MADSTNTHRKLEDSYLPKAVLDIFLLGLHGYRRNDTGIKHLFDSILIAKRNIIAFFSQVKRWFYEKYSLITESKAEITKNAKMSEARNYCDH